MDQGKGSWRKKNSCVESKGDKDERKTEKEQGRKTKPTAMIQGRHQSLIQGNKRTDHCRGWVAERRKVTRARKENQLG